MAESTAPPALGARLVEGRERHAEPTAAARLALIVLGLVILSATLIRVRLLNVPFERDEGEYAYQGALILSGVPPYTNVYTQKLPGTHLLYALSMAVFGQTVSGARVALVLATSATCLGVFLLGRRLFSPVGALAGAAACAILSLSTEMLGPFGHATHFVAAFAVWGLVALAWAVERGGILGYLLSGVLLGLAVLMKQHGLVFAACAALWIAIGPTGQRARGFAALLLGGAIPIALLGIWFAVTGTLGAFWFWVVRYAAAYGTMQGLGDGWNNLKFTASRFLPQAVFLWLLALAGATLLLTRRFPRVTRLRLGTLLILSFIGVCPGLYFRDHYFLLLVPAAALLVGAASEAIGAVPRFGPALAPALLLFACGQALWTQREIFFRASADEVSRLVYGPDLFPEAIEIGRYLRAHTKPDDTIVVFGSEPEIPFYARRRSATGFVFVYPLMQTHRDTRSMQERMVREVETARPAYAVLVKTPTSWLEQPDSDHLMQDWAVRYLNDNYALVGQVLQTGRGSRYLWDAAALRHPLTNATQALVMRRRELGADR